MRSRMAVVLVLLLRPVSFHIPEMYLGGKYMKVGGGSSPEYTADILV